MKIWHKCTFYSLALLFFGSWIFQLNGGGE